jgi:hypothetical protein
MTCGDKHWVMARGHMQEKVWSSSELHQRPKMPVLVAK